MGFHDVRFPVWISRGSSGGPERRTEIVTLANGFEQRNSPWAHSRRRYDAGIGLRGLDDLAEVIAFFEARQGRLHAFRWKDWTDFRSCAPGRQPAFDDQVIGTGDGTTTAFGLVKAYVSGGASYLRRITKPVPLTVRAGRSGLPLLEGADYSVDHATGRVVFPAPPAPGEVITAGFEFDVPVRFDTDALHLSAASVEAGEIPSIPVIEVRS
ncbi:MAG: DUF2460 domain-containing protein [Rhodobacteraceae bacterium]|nr:DUF2460 domain-containing protein [Paracoccaceae bacterium]